MSATTMKNHTIFLIFWSKNRNLLNSISLTRFMTISKFEILKEWNIIWISTYMNLNCWNINRMSRSKNQTKNNYTNIWRKRQFSWKKFFMFKLIATIRNIENDSIFRIESIRNETKIFYFDSIRNEIFFIVLTIRNENSIRYFESNISYISSKF